MINSFRGSNYFLSNFYESPVQYFGNTYRNNESAFQAQKTTNENDRVRFFNLTGIEAKQLGRSVRLRSDWESVKENIMYEICLAKFTQNKDLTQKLINTGNQILEEGNTWGDREWGTVKGVGKNKLGKILMRVRDDLK